MPDRGTALNVLAPAEAVAPGDNMGPSHRAEFFWPIDTGEAHEIADRVFVGTPGAAVADMANHSISGGTSASRETLRR
jgi:hypothetical protein